MSIHFFKFLIASFFLIITSSIIILNYKQCTDRSIGSLKQIKEFYIFKNFSNIKDLSETEFKEKQLKYRYSMSVETLILILGSILYARCVKGQLPPILES